MNLPGPRGVKKERRALAGVGALRSPTRGEGVGARRTTRQITLVVETRDMSAEEHDKRVFWAENNIGHANAKMDGAYVAVIIRDSNGKVIRFTGSGDPTDETRLLIDELSS
jgi:hypothetical protein